MSCYVGTKLSHNGTTCLLLFEGVLEFFFLGRISLIYFGKLNEVPKIIE
jgi:hypothetical protein